jgi:hypothetical protein
MTYVICDRQAIFGVFARFPWEWGDAETIGFPTLAFTQFGPDWNPQSLIARLNGHKVRV